MNFIVIGTKNPFECSTTIEVLKKQMQRISKYKKKILLIDPYQDQLSNTIKKKGKVTIFLTTRRCYPIDEKPYDVLKIIKHHNVELIGNTLKIIKLVENKTKMLRFLGMDEGIFFTDETYLEQLKYSDLLKYPSIVKPNNTTGSYGVGENSIVYNYNELASQSRSILKLKGVNGVRIESYDMNSKEYAVGVIGNSNDGYQFSFAELKLDKIGHKIITCEEKLKLEKDRNIRYNIVEEPIKNQLRALLVPITYALNIRDYARFDVINSFGKYRLIDVNALTVLGRSFAFEWLLNGNVVLEDLLKLICEKSLQKSIFSEKD